MLEIFFGKKPEVVVEIKRSWAEIMIDLAREHTAAFVTIMQAFIVAHVIVALICIIRQMYKGRPSHISSFQQKEQAATISISNNITTTNDQSRGDMENIGNQINYHTIDPRVFINPPPQLTMDTHIPTWLELVELYVLKEKVEDVKYTIMMGYVQPEVMKQLNITSQSKSRAEKINRWIDMKEQLMKLHETKFNENFEEGSINFKTMGERIQGINESTSQFGKSLLEMAQKLLESDNIAVLKDTLQSQFIYGPNNKEIAEKLMTRLYDRELEKKELSKQEALDYANHLEQVFKTTKKCNDQIEAKRNFC
jgi:hypothetical protein